MNSYELGAKAWWPPGQEAAEEYIEYAKEFDESTCLEHYDLVAQSVRACHVDADAGRAIAGLLSNLIETKTPASFIRLGDADGNVLFARMGIYPELAAYNLTKISRIYFGSNTLMSDHLDFFFDSVIESIHEADLIGGPERGTIEKSFSTPYPDLDVRGMCGMRGVYNQLATSVDLTAFADKVWASTWYSRSLLPHYFSLVRGLPFLGFISCYPELEGAFRAQADIGDAQTILVPKQASIAKVHKDIGHYPEAYPAVLAQIDPPYEGAVYLVAAGILSKPYCTEIKRRGGIAIDVGSVADIWMGVRTRPNIQDDFIAKWTIV